jgi:large subunit ribosomal protein L22
MRLVIDLIRGKSVDEALTILHFSAKQGAKTAEKVLRSAVSNIHNKDEGARLDTHEMFVKEAFVDGGAVLKRVLPAPMGRAYQILKRSNHITIIVASKEKKEKKHVKAETTGTKAAKSPAPKAKE